MRECSKYVIGSFCRSNFAPEVEKRALREEMATNVTPCAMAMGRLVVPGSFYALQQTSATSYKRTLSTVRRNGKSEYYGKNLHPPNGIKMCFVFVEPLR